MLETSSRRNSVFTQLWPGSCTTGNLDYWELGVQSSSSDVIYKFFWGLCLMENLSVSGHWNWGHSIDSHLFVQVQYRIAGNFWGRKLSQIGEKYDLCSVDCSFVPHQRMPCPQKPQNHKICKHFFLSKVSRYTVFRNNSNSSILMPQSVSCVAHHTMFQSDECSGAGETVRL